MGIKSKIRKAAPELASRPTRSQRRKDALVTKAEAAAAGRPSKRPWGKTPGAAMSKSYPQGLAATLRRKPTAGTLSRPARFEMTTPSRLETTTPSRLKATPQGLAATLRRKPTAGTLSRPARLKTIPQRLSSRKRSR